MSWIISDGGWPFCHAQPPPPPLLGSRSAANQEENADEEGQTEFETPADAVALVVHYESMSRNKRLLLAYM